MSDLESFSPSESTEGVDPAALERLREQMKKASAGMKKDQQQEQKQKKTEDVMFNTLVLLMQKLGADHPLIFYIVKCLADNISADILVTVISLIITEVQPVSELKMLNPTQETPKDLDEKALIISSNALGASEIPLYIRLNLETWIKLINTKVFLNPVRNLPSLLNHKDKTVAKHSITDLMSYCAQEYLLSQKITFDGHLIEKYIRALMANLISRLQTHLASTKTLTE